MLFVVGLVIYHLFEVVNRMVHAVLHGLKHCVVNQGADRDFAVVCFIA